MLGTLKRVLLYLTNRMDSVNVKEYKESREYEGAIINVNGY